MHRVGTRSEGNTFGTSVGSSTGLFAVHHIGSDSQQGEGRTGILVNRQFLQFFAEEVYQVYAKVVYLVVVVTEAREFSFDVEAFCQTDIVAAGSYFRIFDGRQ